ncbi:MAG: C25 family cysteine peptidase [Candidatus Cloacimonadaceae bacterium]|jgi:uncharacterized repeat protein (TIGR01451 family)|nr:C25 family cysteine peptidase [Candidatus Cloacimonadota bacterium]MCK9242246.1 C25 family cysteine peptidase [Candidatus Cloacimonadota bacterium]MDY0126703.1 C25 family cysteine peptidase [Candidatus Cloacimonadaceae bacterium]
MKRMLILLALIITISTLFAERFSLGSEGNSLQVLQSSALETVLQYQIQHFDTKEVQIQGSSWHHINLPGEGITQDKGLPQLPIFNRSISIDGMARMKQEIYDVEYTDIKLPIAPSKGVITRDIDPATVPYEFDPVYQSSRFYPEMIATLSEPYILRDIRGITIKTIPFAYRPSTGTLRVYTSYKVRVYADGIDTLNTMTQSRDSVSRAFAPLYENHFVNWENHRYTPVDDSYGKLLVICHTNFMSTILPWVNWKKQKGIETELVQWSSIGTTASQLQSYIQNYYNNDNDLTYVQIVGDAPQIPTLSFSGGGSDPSFSLVAGNDNYPDIFIGRFSAETVDQLNVQLNRSIAYERDLNTSATWLSRAMGIASDEGGPQGDNGETDIQHLNVIRTKLLNYGYSTVDQVYDPGASASTVSANVNSGRGYINYIGHGSNTSWITSGFNVSNAMALTNGNKAPFIVDVACINGNFVSMTCFAEGWMRSSNGGAISIYASTINQSWATPMRAQDEIADLWVAESKNTVGGLYYNGSCKMMDFYGSDGVKMFKTWHIFGDASLMVRSKTPVAMNPNHPAQIVTGSPALSISNAAPNALVSLTYNNQIYARGYANSSGSLSLPLSGLPAQPCDLTLTITAHNRVSYVATVEQIPASGPFVSVENLEYADGNNQAAEYGENATFNVSFKNAGTAVATNVNATLSSSTAGITITDASEALGNLAAGASIIRNNAFAFAIGNSFADGSLAEFNILMQSGSESWNHAFTIEIAAPVLNIGDFTISDPGGNNNGKLDPGETVTLSIPILNDGGAVSPAGRASLSSFTNGITIINSNANFPAISAGGSQTAIFTVSAAASMAQGTMATFNVNTSAGAYSSSGNITLEVGAPETITIGSGTSTQTYPLYRYYNYSSHEALYLASEIGTGGSIKSLGYYKASGSDTNPIQNTAIYMKHSTASSLSSGTYSTSGYTLVFSGSFPNTASSGWMEVELDTRFDYDGISNLSILVVKGNQSWTSSYPRWTYSASGSTRARQNHSDYSQPTSLTASSNLPNLRLQIIQNEPAEDPLIAASPASISESVNSGNSVSREITISNTGTADLNWSIPSRDVSGSTLTCDATSFSAGSSATWSFTVSNGSTDAEWIKDIQITFPPAVTVNSVSDFTGGSDSMPASPQSGNGITINWHYEDSSGYSGIHGGETATATVNVSIAASAAGNLNLPWIITGDDYGSAPHSVSGSINLSGTGSVTMADWVSLSSYSGSIAAGASAIITVTMDSEGLADGSYNSGITISSNASNNPALSIPLSLTVETPMNPYPVQPRLVAEWEPAQGAIVRYPFGQPYSLLADLSEDALLYVIVSSANQSAANSNMQSNGVNMANIRYINAASDSYWVRDYGPWAIFDAERNMHLVDFVYNRPRPNDNLIPSVFAGYLDTDLYDLDMNHTGGNLMADGMGKAMSTELVLSENSSLTESQINQRFSDVLGITEYQIYTDPTNTYIDHIDCWAKLLDVDKVLIRRVPPSHAQYSAIEQSVAQWQAKSSSYGTPYRIFRVDTPNNEPYSNSFIMNGNIYVPQMSTSNDAAALAVYRTAMPGYTVRGYTHSSYQSTDALHCRVNTVFDDQMIAVRHTPLNDLTAYQEYSFTVQIDHSNALDSEASFIAWSTSSSGPWQQSSLSHEGANSYSTSITSGAYLQSIYYWIQASDITGRVTTLPLCGGLDPFVAQVSSPNPDLPNWIPQSYPNPAATIHAQISFFGNPAQENDLVGAFVNGECRGTGLVFNDRNSFVSMQVHLAQSGETVKFKIYSRADDQGYDADLMLNPDFGEVIGSDLPIELIFSLNKPTVSISQSGSHLLLSWPAVSNAEFYRILAADSPDGVFSLFLQSAATSLQINPDAARRFYKVVAVKGEERLKHKPTD